MAKKGKVLPKREVTTKRRLTRWQRERRRRRITIILGSLVIAIILAVIGYGYYASTAPAREWVTKVKVDDTYTVFTGADYLKVLRLYPSSQVSPEAPLLRLEENELVRQGAAEFDIGVTDEEINQQIEELFPGAEGIDEQAYQQFLSFYGLTNEEFREVIETGLLQQRLEQHLMEKVPEDQQETAYQSWLEEQRLERVERNPNLDLDKKYRWAMGKLS